MQKRDFMNLARSTVSSYSGLLGLAGWDIRIGDPDDFDFELEEEGYILIQSDERTATIYAHPCADRWQLVRIVVHEMLHVVLTDVEFIGCNGASIEQMDVFNRALERAIGQLTGALSGLPQWQPVVECQKEAHAPAINITLEDAG